MHGIFPHVIQPDMREEHPGIKLIHCMDYIKNNSIIRILEAYSKK